MTSNGVLIIRNDRLFSFDRDWAIDLENPKKNTVECCQLCSIQEDIKRVTSPEWSGQPASYNPYEWKIRYK